MEDDASGQTARDAKKKGATEHMTTACYNQAPVRDVQFFGVGDTATASGLWCSSESPHFLTAGYGYSSLSRPLGYLIFSPMALIGDPIH